MTTTVANITIGRRDVDPDAPSHIRGVVQGNATVLDKIRGLVARGQEATGTAERSTGINPRDRDPIDPRMPNLSPA